MTCDRALVMVRQSGQVSPAACCPQGPKRSALSSAWLQQSLCLPYIVSLSEGKFIHWETAQLSLMLIMMYQLVEAVAYKDVTV